MEHTHQKAAAYRRKLDAELANRIDRLSTDEKDALQDYLLRNGATIDEEALRADAEAEVEGQFDYSAYSAKHLRDGLDTVASMNDANDSKSGRLNLNDHLRYIPMAVGAAGVCAAISIAGTIAISPYLERVEDASVTTEKIVTAAEAEGPVPEDDAMHYSPELSRKISLQEWRDTERGEALKLYRGLVDVVSDTSLTSMVRRLPRHVSFVNRKSGRRSNVGPETYLFELRGKANTTAWTLHWGIERSDAHLNYVGNITEKAAELDLVKGDVPEVDMAQRVVMYPFYESVRNPSREELGLLYEVFQAVPRAIIPSTVVGEVERNARLARPYLEKDIMFYEGDWEENIDRSTGRPLLNNWLSGEKDPHGESKIAQRLDNGELYVPMWEPDDITYSSHFSRTHNVFPEEIENMSGMAKWFIRRGEPFTTNAVVITKGLFSSSNEAEFVQYVLDNKIE